MIETTRRDDAPSDDTRPDKSAATADPLAGFARVDPSQAGVDADGLVAFLEAQADAGLDVHSFVMLRHGSVLAEGWAAPYLTTNRQLLYSLSKTFTSAAAGIAVSEGLFGYDDLLVDHFPDLADGASEKARTIRVRNALSMATGHTTDQYPMGGPLTRASLRGLFVPGPDGEPGVTFAYNQLATYSVARIVEQTSGLPLLDFLNDRLFSKLGITEAGWGRDDEGLALGFSGLHLRTGSIASFFQLLADGGVRDGVRLLPEEWITEHRRKQVETAEGNPDWSQGYGWQCWIARHGYRGDGAYGQYGIILPEQDVVIAMTGEQDDMQRLLDLVWQHVLPAIDREGSADADRRLVDWLGGWWIDPVSGDVPGSVSGDDGMGGRLEIDGDSLTWTDRDGVVNQSPLGVDESWTLDTWTWPTGSLDVALSAAATDDGATVVRVMVTSTPHSFTWTLRSGQATGFAWRFAPLHGAGPQQLALA